MINDRVPNPHGGLGGLDLGRGDDRSPKIEVDGIGGHQPNMAVNARAGVPPGGGLGGGVGANGEHIGMAGAGKEMAAEFVTEAAITIGPFA